MCVKFGTVQMFVFTCLCNVLIFLSFSVVAEGCTAGGCHAVLGRGGDDGGGAKWLRGNMSAVSHDDRRALPAISAPTRASQLRHAHLLSGAHQHV